MPITPKSATVSVILAVVVCLVDLGVVHLGLLEKTELQGYDLLVSSSELQSPPDEVVIVDFDDASVEALNAFPIPRALLADVLEKIAVGEPELIGLDVLLDKARDPRDDERLVRVIAGAGNVILAEVFGSVQLPASAPLRQFRQEAFDVGFANLPVDGDGLIRRMFLWMRDSNYEQVSFPIVLASNYLQQPLQVGRPGFVRLGGLEIPLYEGSPNSSLIGFRSLPPAQSVTVQRLLEPDFDPLMLKGKIVLVGQSSTAAKDLYRTPVFRSWRPGTGRPMLSGVEIHAAAIATLLSGKTIRVMGNLSLWTLNILLAWLVIALILTFRPIYGLSAAIAGVVVTYLLAQVLFSDYQVWVKFISTEAGIFLAVPAGLGYRFLEERRLKAHAEAERGELVGLFERYVSPEVVAEIWNRREEIVLAGQEKHATVLFSDIRNFTALTAGKASAEVLAWLNDYFDAMSEIIKRNGGFLNKFIGDGMLVLFGVPVSHGVGEDACGAVRAALEMVKRVEELNSRQDPSRPQFTIGVGLHTGTLTAGNVGARDRLEYSVIGETVNLASRLEALTKNFNTNIVMTPQTWELVKGQFQTASLDEVEVRGFPGKIRVYTVVT